MSEKLPSGLSGKKPESKVKSIYEIEDLINEPEKPKEEVKLEETKEKSKEEQQAETVKLMDEMMQKHLNALQEPEVIAKVAELGEKLFKSPYVLKKEKEMIMEELTAVKSLEEAEKMENKINEKLEITGLTAYAGKITDKIEKSSLSEEEKAKLDDLVIGAENLNDLKKVEKDIENQLFTIKGDTVEFSNDKLTLGHIFPSESEKSVILVDGKPAFLNPNEIKDGRAQYCYALVTGEYGDRAKVYSGKTKVKQLNEQEANNYFENGIPRPIKPASTEPKKLEKDYTIPVQKVVINDTKEEIKVMKKGNKTDEEQNEMAKK
ncbi:MAG: hypothetical protein WC269_04815 [Candidatus Gracilibacteria bacterium]|jgi:hypothetical protein